MATATASKAEGLRLVSLKRVHDKMLEEMPEGSSHDALGCELCAMDDDNHPSRRGGSVGKTFTEEEMAEQIKTATADLEEQVKQLRTAQGQNEVEAKIAEATKPFEDRVAELQGQLDEKVLEAKLEKERAEGILSWLEEQKTEAEEQAALEQRKGERIEKVREVTKFDDDYIEQNSDRWAAMADEAFEAVLDGWKEQAAAYGDDLRPATSELPRETAFRASSESGPTSKRRTSAAREVMGFRRQGIDARTIR